MHIINFLLAVFLPYISLFSKLAPPETIPAYFFSEEAAFVAGEFGAVIFYWAGFLRHYVATGNITERKYFFSVAMVLAFMCVSKIIFTLPYTWITDIFAFGLGVLSISAGQVVGKKTMVLMIIISSIILAYSVFILIGLAWFSFHPSDFYRYRDLIQMYIHNMWIQTKYLLTLNKSAY